METKEEENILEQIGMVGAFFGFKELGLIPKGDCSNLYMAPAVGRWGDWMSGLNTDIEHIAKKINENTGLPVEVNKFLPYDNPSNVKRGSVVVKTGSKTIMLFPLPNETIFKPENKNPAPLMIPKIIKPPKKKKFWEFWK